MLRIYQYLFYKYYSLSLSNGEEEPVYAFCIIAGLSAFNILTLIGLVAIIMNTKVVLLPRPISIFLVAIHIFTQYVLLVRNGKHKKLVKEFRVNPPISSGIGTLLAWGYIFITVISFITVANTVRSM